MMEKKMVRTPPLQASGEKGNGEFFVEGEWRNLGDHRKGI